MHVGVNVVRSDMPQKTLHQANSLANSTGRHKIHVRLYERGPGVCYLQQLPLDLWLPLYSVLPARFRTSVCVYFRAQLCGLENHIASNIM